MSSDASELFDFSTYTTEVWNSDASENGTEHIFVHYFTTVDYSSSNRTSTVSRFYPLIAAELALSVLCLILSIIIYSILPEFRNVHGKNLISLSSCLLTTFSFLILDLILRRRISYSFCFLIAIIIHITFVATFFWTNVMAYDIWRSITKMAAKNHHKSSSRKYLKYSIYAWIATILATIPAATFEATDLIPLRYRPSFGVTRCWLSGFTAFAYYFNLPVGVILFGNLVMFLLTIRKLWMIKKMTAILQTKKHEQRLNLYLKLFLVMGITWATEFIPWMTGIFELYAVAGMITALHGVILFFIFVFKKRIFRQMWEICHLGQLPTVLQKSANNQSSTFYYSDTKSSSHKDSVERI
ncbi:G-protein coupled receptor Mth2-like [Uloborus diversus]|uniref:G-protein coupled receptor Mth2-like n=1 Tax=Uloborus diversus TaxID=327109 RepID=UPI00240A7CBF|nr:G-protein coupled receptor Mth2-like [Uloborus diversus]